MGVSWILNKVTCQRKLLFCMYRRRDNRFMATTRVGVVSHALETGRHLHGARSFVSSPSSEAICAHTSPFHPTPTVLLSLRRPIPLPESRMRVKSPVLPCSPPLYTSRQSPDGCDSSGGSGGGKLRAAWVRRGGKGRCGGQCNRKAASSLAPLPSSSPSLLPSSWPAPLISTSVLDLVFRFQILV
jgi:hypothetical protein